MAQLLTIKDLAKQLNVSNGCVYNWINQSKVPYIKLNGAVRSDQGKIDKWIAARSVKTSIGGMYL